MKTTWSNPLMMLMSPKRVEVMGMDTEGMVMADTEDMELSISIVTFESLKDTIIVSLKWTKVLLRFLMKKITTRP